MPKFPHSNYSASPASGVFVRNQGGPSPLVEADDAPKDELVHPFKVTARKDGSNVKVKVRAGTVNNLVPTISSTALDASARAFAPNRSTTTTTTTTTKGRMMMTMATNKTRENSPDEIGT